MTGLLPLGDLIEGQQQYEQGQQQGEDIDEADEPAALLFFGGIGFAGTGQIEIGVMVRRRRFAVRNTHDPRGLRRP